MFEASAARIFATDAAQVVHFLPQAVYEASATQLAQTQPYFWQGRSYGSVWGMHAEVTVRTMTTPDGTSVHVTVGAQVDQNALIALILIFFFFFPVALVLTLLGYNDFTARRVMVIEGIFSRLSAATGKPALAIAFAPNVIYPAYPPPGSPMPPGSPPPVGK
jgi:hypothetical protein